MREFPSRPPPDNARYAAIPSCKACAETGYDPPIQVGIAGRTPAPMALTWAVAALRAEMFGVCGRSRTHEERRQGLVAQNHRNRRPSRGRPVRLLDVSAGQEQGAQEVVAHQDLACLVGPIFFAPKLAVLSHLTRTSASHRSSSQERSRIPRATRMLWFIYRRGHSAWK